ncbi:MAG: ABC-type branched-subunit amino acid transport system substrate-binding protein, partial [bacterium]
FARVYDSEKVWILGGSELNHSQNFLLKSVARLRFADTFSVGQSDTALQPFFEKHWKFYNHQKYYQKPTVYTLYGYEALQVLTSLLNDPKNHNREALREAIQKLDKVKVLSGNITALENGELVKNVQILKMYKGQTTKVFR